MYLDRQVWKNSVDLDYTAPAATLWIRATLVAMSPASIGGISLQ